MLKGATAAYEGITTTAFEAAVTDFFETARHPSLGVPYFEVAYRPMRELIAFLEASGFQVYICSGGAATSCDRSPSGCTAFRANA